MARVLGSDPDDIDLDRLWTTVTDDLPPLVAALELILSRPTG